VISGDAKSDEAEEIVSVISGSAMSDEAEEEGFAFLVIEEFALDEECKTSPPDPSRLEAKRKQIELLVFMENICNKNTATLDKTCPLPSLICQVTKWFIRLPDHWKNLISRSSYLISKIHVSAIPLNQMKSWRPCPRWTYTRSISSLTVRV
jgi:hypothetical protein